MILLVVLGVCIVVFAIDMVLDRMSTRQVASYSNVREAIIHSYADPNPIDRSSLKRPEGLDTRLDSSFAQYLRSLDPDSSEALQVLFKVNESIYEELCEINSSILPVELISKPRQVVNAVYWTESEVNNGGFSQFYLNSSGDFAADAPEFIREVGLPAFADLVDRANAHWPCPPPRDRGVRLDMLDDVEAEADEDWERLSSAFYESEIDCLPYLIRYILKNESEFFLPAD